MRITRREIVAAAIVCIAAAGGVLYAFPPAFLGGKATADTPIVLAAADELTNEQLLRPGPLPDLVQGKDDAPVTIVEYASMTCPHCAAFHHDTYPELKAKYIDTGKVRFIFREFPLDEVALAASMMARCTGSTEKTFTMIDVLFSSQQTWAVRQAFPHLLQIAKQAGFTQKSFEECMGDKTLYNNIVAIRERASRQYKVESTPTLFINGKIQRGEISIQELDKAMQPYLKS